MITVYDDIMTDNDSKEFIDYYENNIDKEYTVNEDIYRFKGIVITEIYNNFFFLRRLGLRLDVIDELRIQRIDNTIKMVETYHSHFDPYSFVCFLNDNFEGGELVFDNNSFQPKKNRMIYFTGDEKHLVKNVSNGYRYTLVCFLKTNLHIIRKIDKLI